MIYLITALWEEKKNWGDSVQAQFAINVHLRMEEVRPQDLVCGVLGASVFSSIKWVFSSEGRIQDLVKVDRCGQ